MVSKREVKKMKEVDMLAQEIGRKVVSELSVLYGFDKEDAERELKLDKLEVNVIENKTVFKVYPNPARSELFVDAPKLDNIISVYSFSGVLLRRVVSNSNVTKINLSDFSSGIYFVELSNNQYKTYQKFIVR